MSLAVWATGSATLLMLLPISGLVIAPAAEGSSHGRRGRMTRPPERALGPLHRVLQGVDAETISIVHYTPPWERERFGSRPLLDRVARRWPQARFHSVDLERGTTSGERAYEVLQTHDFRVSLLEIFRGKERLCSLVLPQNLPQQARGADGAPCPLLLERSHVARFQEALAGALGRVNSNRRWRERRRVLLALRETRQSLRRLERYRDAGLLSKSWEIFKQADSTYSCNAPVLPAEPMCRLDGSTPSFSAERRRSARRKHLKGLVAHARESRLLREQERRLARKQHLLSLLVFLEQRCGPEGCQLLWEPPADMFG